MSDTKSDFTPSIAAEKEVLSIYKPFFREEGVSYRNRSYATSTSPSATSLKHTISFTSSLNDFVNMHEVYTIWYYKYILETSAGVNRAMDESKETLVVPPRVFSLVQNALFYINGTNIGGLIEKIYMFRACTSYLYHSKENLRSYGSYWMHLDETNNPLGAIYVQGTTTLANFEPDTQERVTETSNTRNGQLCQIRIPLMYFIPFLEQQGSRFMLPLKRLKVVFHMEQNHKYTLFNHGDEKTDVARVELQSKPELEYVVYKYSSAVMDEYKRRVTLNPYIRIPFIVYNIEEHDLADGAVSVDYTEDYKSVDLIMNYFFRETAVGVYDTDVFNFLPIKAHNTSIPNTMVGQVTKSIKIGGREVPKGIIKKSDSAFNINQVSEFYNEFLECAKYFSTQQSPVLSKFAYRMHPLFVTDCQHIARHEYLFDDYPKRLEINFTWSGAISSANADANKMVTIICKEAYLKYNLMDGTHQVFINPN